MRIVLLLAALSVATAAPTAEEFDARVSTFQHHWDRFLRGQWGCSSDSVSRQDCNPSLAHTDFREFEAARKAAAKLFDLHE